MEKLAWYYVHNGQSVGPLSHSQLSKLLADCQLPSDTPVWSSELQNWTPASAVADFRQLLSVAAAQYSSQNQSAPSGPNGNPVQAQPPTAPGEPGNGNGNGNGRWGDLDSIGRTNSPACNAQIQPTAPRENGNGNGIGNWGDLDAIGRAPSPSNDVQNQPNATGETSNGNGNGRWGDLNAIGKTNVPNSDLQTQSSPATAQATNSKWGDLDAIGKPGPSGADVGAASLAGSGTPQSDRTGGTREAAWSNPELFYNAFLKNSYRVLGVVGSISQVDLKKTLTNIRRQAKIGKKYKSDVDLAWAGAVARTDKDILEAETRLLNPESRLEQRLLWFHAPPEELPAELTARSAFEMAQQWSQLNGPTTLHDAAVLMYFASIVESPDCKREDLWKQTLDMWRRVVEDEQYWSAMCSVEETLGYEPACLPGEVMAWREELLGLVTAPLLVLSRHAMHENNNDVVARVARLLGNDEKASSELVQELFRKMDGATVRLDAIMSKVIAKEEDYDKNIALNASICSEAEEVYNKLVPGILTQAESVLDKGDPELLHLREAAASILIDIAQAASWAADFELADRVLSKARPLASGTAAEPKLHDSETKLENARASHEVTKGSKPIKSAPPLMTINTFGFMVYPAMGEQADVVYGSKRAIYYLVALFIPLFPIASYRVVFLPGGSYRFLCKVPLDRAARIHQAVVALLIGLLVFSVATYKPDPRVVAANTSKVVARVTFPGAEKVQLPDDKYSLRDIVNEDEEALDDLEGQLKQVKAQCEKMAPRLEKSQNKLKSILPSEPTDSSESAAAIKYNNDGVTCLKSSDFKGAIVNFEKALSTDPKYQIAMANLAIAYNNLALAQSKSEPKLSVSSFYRSLCFDLYNKTTWQNLDSMLKYLGKHPEQAKERLALAEKAKAAHDYRAAAIEYLAVLKVKQDPKVAHDKVKSKLEEVIAKLPAPEQSALKASLNQERDNPEVAELKRKHNAMVDRYNALLADGDKKYAVMKKILDERNKAAEKYNKLYADK